jgi:hypothetical protein
MPTKQVSRKKSGSHRRTKSAAQKRHQARAAQAMKIYKSGKASSLKKAWAKV